MKDMWDALLEHEPSLKQATNVRLTRGKGYIAGCVLLPGPVTIEFDLPDGVAPPGQGMITQIPGEEPKITRLNGKIPVATAAKKNDSAEDPWEARIAEEEAAAKKPRVVEVYLPKESPVAKPHPDHDPAQRSNLFREVSRRMREQGALDLPDEVGFGPYEPEK